MKGARYGAPVQVIKTQLRRTVRRSLAAQEAGRVPGKPGMKISVPGSRGWAHIGIKRSRQTHCARVVRDAGGPNGARDARSKAARLARRTRKKPATVAQAVPAAAGVPEFPAAAATKKRPAEAKKRPAAMKKPAATGTLHLLEARRLFKSTLCSRNWSHLIRYAPIPGAHFPTNGRRGASQRCGSRTGRKAKLLVRDPCRSPGGLKRGTSTWTSGRTDGFSSLTRKSMRPTIFGPALISLE